VTGISPETAVQVLDLPMPEGNDADAATIRDYLVALVRQVWVENEGFSGKRPFGNSGWQDDLYVTIMRAGLVNGSIDVWNELGEDFDEPAADALILAAIDELGRVTS
jgi:hypothetical protein